VELVAAEEQLWDAGDDDRYQGVGTSAPVVWGVCVSVLALIGVLGGAVVGFVAFAACAGDSHGHDDGDVAYRTWSIVVAAMAGMISGVFLAAVVRLQQRRAVR
jgi:hypothetical protein